MLLPNRESIIKSEVDSERTIYQLIQQTFTVELGELVTTCCNVKPADCLIAGIISFVSLLTISFSIGFPLVFVYDIDVRSSDETTTTISTILTTQQDNDIYDASYSQFYDRTKVSLQCGFGSFVF